MLTIAIFQPPEQKLPVLNRDLPLITTFHNKLLTIPFAPEGAVLCVAGDLILIA